MRYKHLIFDIDGTLVDNEKAVIITWQQTIEQLFDKHYEASDLDFVLGIPGEISMQQLGAKNPKAAFATWSKNFMVHKSEIELFPNILNTILTLKEKGLILGLVTSRTHDELNNDDALCKIIDNFNTIICVTDTLRPKPYPDPLLVYLEKYDISPRDALYIGDSSYDSQCAKGAKVDFGLAMWGQSSHKNINAKYFLKSPNDILDL